jgi:hypothetical protein
VSMTRPLLSAIGEERNIELLRAMNRVPGKRGVVSAVSFYLTQLPLPFQISDCSAGAIPNSYPNIDPLGDKCGAVSVAPLYSASAYPGLSLKQFF